MRGFLLMLFLALPVAAQKASLRWKPSPTPGTTVNLYRGLGPCPAATYALLESNLPAGGPAIDSTVASGNTYCWYVTAVLGSTESNPSNTLMMGVPSAPGGFTGSVLPVIVNKTITYQMAPLSCPSGGSCLPPKLTCSATYNSISNSIVISCHT